MQRATTAVDPAERAALYRQAESLFFSCLLYTSDAADERSSVDLGGRRIIKKKNNADNTGTREVHRKRESNTQSQGVIKAT